MPGKTFKLMKREQTLISWCEENDQGFDECSLTVHTFGSRAEAKDFILRNLEAESRELDTPLKSESGDIQDMWNRDEGSFSYRIGDHVYHVHFLNEKGEYNVSDDELFAALDAYANSGRSGSEFERMAKRISVTMHRYVQNELWRFVKHVIHAFACGGSDTRNRTAQRQASAIQTFMEGSGEF